MDPIKLFQKEVRSNIDGLMEDKDLRSLSNIWIREITRHKYAYNFSWMGRPAIQIPQDMVALQEIIWKTNPDLIIETGIAHGGSLIMNASYLSLIEYAEAVSRGTTLDPQAPKRKVLGIDIDIRAHNRKAIQNHPMNRRIEMIEGSSIDPKVVESVYQFSEQFKSIMVILDSNHTHEHVFEELKHYAPLVSRNNYLLVFDTVIEDMPSDFFPDRRWSKGNNPKTAIRDFFDYLDNHKPKCINGEDISFEIDKEIEAKIQITVAPDGYLLRK